jgi:hypothetical protein
MNMKPCFASTFDLPLNFFIHHSDKILLVMCLQGLLEDHDALSWKKKEEEEEKSKPRQQQLQDNQPKGAGGKIIS